MSTTSEAWVTGPHSTQFYTRTYASPEPNPIARVIWIHGFIENISREGYRVTFAQWAARRISVFAYDQRGFGRTGSDKVSKSPSSSWGKTSWKNQMEDIAFFVRRERENIGPHVPIFLMGQSMGGGEVLGFAATPPTSPHALAELSGIIAAAPLIRQTSPVAKWQTFIGGMVANVMPAMLLPAPVISEDISRDPKVRKAFDEDPLIRQYGSLRGLSDMFAQGICLAEKNYKNWPVNLPLLILHGTADKVTSHTASEKFIKDINATDKTLSLYEGGYHELYTEPDNMGTRFIEECATWIEQRATIKRPSPEGDDPVTSKL